MTLPPPYSLAQCIARMPLHARSRLEDLKALVADATALVNTLQERYATALREYSILQTRYARAVKTGDTDAAKKLEVELQAIASKAEKLERERSRRISVKTNTEQVVIRLESFAEAAFMGFPSNVVWPPQITVEPRLQKGETAIDTITRLRREIDQVRGEVAKVRAAPLPAVEICGAVMDQVDAMAEQGKPLLSVANGTQVRLDWPDEMPFTVPGMGGLSAPAGSASKLFCWLHRDQIIRRLIAGIVDLEGCIPSAERPARLQALEGRLFQLEVQEEHWVAQAIAGGLEVHRRSDASPWAQLGFGLQPPQALIAEAAE